MEGFDHVASGPGYWLNGWGLPSVGVPRKMCWTPPSLSLEGWGRQQQSTSSLCGQIVLTSGIIGVL